DDPKWGKEQLCPRCAESEDPVEEFGIGFISGEERFSRIQGNEYTNYAKILGLKDIEAIRAGVSPTDPRAFTGTGVFHANRGILFIDEFPSIPTNVQVLLHTILEERRVILEEYNLEQPVDLLLISTGNPEGFAHVNRIPASVLDGMELIHMDLPEENMEKEIMLKERFKYDLSSHYTPTASKSLEEKVKMVDLGLLNRNTIIPWWIAQIVSKTVDYTRHCDNLDSGASIWGAKKAIDHTYASIEMDDRNVATLKDACDGLKLSLRGRIKIRADLVDFGEDPRESFKKIDTIIEDIMRHATKAVSYSIYDTMSYGKGVAQDIMRLLSAKKADQLL
ncbi:MAG: AAA family ATPase, partial [Halobacteriota archaeon]|nr:AAA family ATPase [Halobacteriota archaeon]